MSYRAPQGPLTPIAVIKQRQQAHWSYWLGQAIVALHIAKHDTGRSETECLATLAQQDIHAVDEAVLGSLIYGLADHLDDERENIVPVNLQLRRTLRKMGTGS